MLFGATDALKILCTARFTRSIFDVEFLPPPLINKSARPSSGLFRVGLWKKIPFADQGSETVVQDDLITESFRIGSTIRKLFCFAPVSPQTKKLLAASRMARFC